MVWKRFSLSSCVNSPHLLDSISVPAECCDTLVERPRMQLALPDFSVAICNACSMPCEHETGGDW